MFLIQGSKRNVLINIVHFVVSFTPSPELVRRKAVTPSTTELLNHSCRLVVNCLLLLEGFVTIWKNRAEELFKFPLLKIILFHFIHFAHCFGFSWVIFQGVKITLLILCCPLASTGIVKNFTRCKMLTDGMSVLFPLIN